VEPQGLTTLLCNLLPRTSGPYHVFVDQLERVFSLFEGSFGMCRREYFLEPRHLNKGKNRLPLGGKQEQASARTPGRIEKGLEHPALEHMS
jgi:hypothetical protein